MTTSMQSARGASEFTHADSSFFHETSEALARFTGVEDASMHTWTSIIDELLRIRNLEDDWDGEGTEAPHPALVDLAITLAQRLEARGWPTADRAIASVNGTVYLEWYTTALGYEEIEVTSPLDAEYRCVMKDSNTATVFGIDCRP